MRVFILLLALGLGCASNSPGGEEITQSECLGGCNLGALGQPVCKLATGDETAADKSNRQKCEAGVALAIAACRFGCGFAEPDEEP